MALLTTTLVGAQDKQTIFPGSVTLTNASVSVTQIVSIAQDNISQWRELSDIRVLVPPSETGTVAVATYAMGNWDTLTTLSVTNVNASATIVDRDQSEQVIPGKMRLIYTQTGARTNGWKSLIFLK